MFGFQNQRVTNLRMNKHKTGVLRQLPVLGAHVHSWKQAENLELYLWKRNITTNHTPQKFNMEPKNGGLEDDFPFQFRWFLGSMLIFRGVNLGVPWKFHVRFLLCVWFYFVKKSLRETRSAGFFWFRAGSLFLGISTFQKMLFFLPIKRSSRNQTLTPWKINMEPANNPFRKENDLPNLQEYVPC